MLQTCQVCSNERAKYKCPSCGVQSCSLACTKAHKIYCTPKPANSENQDESKPDEAGQPTTKDPEDISHDNQAPPTDADKLAAMSDKFKEILDNTPGLRTKLRNIYKSTLEEAWDSGPQNRPGQQSRKGPHRGPWTEEKGFRRGQGLVQAWRVQCEEGLDTSPEAEGFMKFRELVLSGGKGSDD